MRKVSVITVTLQNRDQLRLTMDSVRAQTYASTEHIVVDGGSTDGSVELLEELNDDGMCYLSAPDQGIYDAMNKGIALCSADSEFAVFMNAGDIFYGPDTLDEAIGREDMGECHVYGSVMKDGRPVEPVRRVNYYTLSTNMICHQSILFRTSLIRNVCYDLRYKICADYKLILECLRLGQQFKYVDIPVAWFDGTGTSSKQREKAREEKRLIRAAYPPVNICYRLKTMFWPFRAF